MATNNVKGTHDIMGEEARAFFAVESLLRECAEAFAYSEVRPPVLEYSEVFVRGVGESSDIVRKEMYTFEDKGGRMNTLRPEFTAGIMRLVVQNKLLFTNELPLKLYYDGPVFRYERPQLGRYRQFNQFGVESVGCPNPMNDVEVISLAYSMLMALGLENVKVKINTLGDDESRTNYKVALKEYFGKHIENMCPDCKQRYEINPLRILDCKVPEDQEIVKDAPKMSDYLSDSAKEKFAFVLSALKKLDIPYEVDDTLVRGLDYYSDTVFEFHYTSAKGNNYGAIGAGGHYDRLIHEMGGPDLPGVGFSFGVERLVSVLTDDGLLPSVSKKVDIYVMAMGNEARMVGMQIANALRMYDITVDYCFDDVKLGNMFKRAQKKNAKYALIIGDNEVNEEKVVLKNLESQEQIEVPNSELIDKVISLIENPEENKKECECGCGGEGHCCCHNKGE